MITDLAPGAATSFVGDVRKFLSAIDHDDAEWIVVDNETSTDLAALLNQIESEKPELIATYRHLYSQGWRWPVSLGEHLDVLTQATAKPVLVLPHPEAEHAAAHSLTDTSHVMAITNHLLGEASLINSALYLPRRRALAGSATSKRKPSSSAIRQRSRSYRKLIQRPPGKALKANC